MNFTNEISDPHEDIHGVIHHFKDEMLIKYNGKNTISWTDGNGNLIAYIKFKPKSGGGLSGAGPKVVGIGVKATLNAKKAWNETKTKKFKK